MRTLLALAALPFLATFAPIELFRMPALPVRSVLTATPVPLDPGHPERRKLGRLTYLGGWVLTSNDPRFGGVSAIHVEGGRVLALSDDGTRFEFPLPRGAPTEVAIERLPFGSDQDQGKLDRDSEALTVHGKDAWVSFEGRNSIWRYDRRNWRKKASARPPALRDWPSNGGGEAMVRLSDGRFLLLAENRRLRRGVTGAILFAGDPAEEGSARIRLGYRQPEGYKVTDAAALPDGRLLLLNRRFTLMSLLNGISAKLVLAEPPPSRPGAEISGEEIASLSPPLTVDNLEGLSVTRENGRTIVWIASDDNFNALQRTLLLKFALDA